MQAFPATLQPANLANIWSDMEQNQFCSSNRFRWYRQDPPSFGCCSFCLPFCFLIIVVQINFLFSPINSVFFLPIKVGKNRLCCSLLRIFNILVTCADWRHVPQNRCLCYSSCTRFRRLYLLFLTNLLIFPVFSFASHWLCILWLYIICYSSTAYYFGFLAIDLFILFAYRLDDNRQYFINLFDNKRVHIYSSKTYIICSSTGLIKFTGCEPLS